jgi:hypothetical protein
MCNGKVRYRSSRLHGVAQTRREEILPITRKHRSASGHFTIASKETRLTVFGYLLPVNERCHEFITLCLRFMTEHGK